MNPERTLYDILEVSQRASAIVVKAANRSPAQSRHPDKNSGAQESGNRLAEINDAYAVVADPAKRMSYDRTLGLTAADRSERRRVVPTNDSDFGHFSTGNNGSRPFGFRPLN